MTSKKPWSRILPSFGFWLTCTYLQRIANLKEAQSTPNSSVVSQTTGGSSSNSLGGPPGSGGSSGVNAGSKPNAKPGISFDTTNLKPLPSPRTARYVCLQNIHFSQSDYFFPGQNFICLPTKVEFLSRLGFLFKNSRKI